MSERAHYAEVIFEPSWKERLILCAYLLAGFKRICLRCKNPTINVLTEPTPEPRDEL